MKPMPKLNSKPLPLLLALAGACSALTAHDAADVLSEEELFEEDLGVQVDVSDPLESVNRVIFEFNDLVYTRRRSVGYGLYKCCAESAQRGASNFFHNLKFPVRLVANVLRAWQGCLG